MKNPDARLSDNQQQEKKLVNGTQFNQLPPLPRFKNNNITNSDNEMQYSTMKNDYIKPLEVSKKVVNPEEIEKQIIRQILNNFITVLCVNLGLIIAIGSFRYLYLYSTLLS